MYRQRNTNTNLTRATLQRVLYWGYFMQSDSNHRWTKTDTETMGKLADEIRRLEHMQYLLRTEKIIINRK
jgi:hypothetical protein